MGRGLPRVLELDRMTAGTAVSRTEAEGRCMLSKAEVEENTHREVLTSVDQPRQMCACVCVWLCDICTHMQQGTNAD